MCWRKIEVCEHPHQTQAPFDRATSRARVRGDIFRPRHLELGLDARPPAPALRLFCRTRLRVPDTLRRFPPGVCLPQETSCLPPLRSDVCPIVTPRVLNVAPISGLALGLQRCGVAQKSATPAFSCRAMRLCPMTVSMFSKAQSRHALDVRVAVKPRLPMSVIQAAPRNALRATMCPTGRCAVPQRVKYLSQ